MRGLRAGALFLCAVATALGAMAPDLEFRFSFRLLVGMLYLLAGASWAVAAAVAGRLEVVKTGMEAPAVLFYAVLAASTVMSICVRSSLVQALTWFALGVGFLVVSNLMTDSRRRALLVVTLIACGAVVAAHGIEQRLVTIPQTREKFASQRALALRQAGVPEDSADDFGGRLEKNWVRGTFVSPNSLGGLLALVFPMALGLTIDQWRERRLVLGREHFVVNILAMAAMLACLYLTNSKGSWLAFGACMVYFYCRSGEWLRRRLGRPLAVAMGAGVVLILIGQQTRLLPPAREYWGSLLARTSYWRGAVEVIARRPLFGVGGGNFGPAYCSVKLGPDEETRLVHNDYLQVAVEMGLIGLLAYLALWWRFWRFVFGRRSPPEEDLPPPGASAGWTWAPAGVGALVFGLAFLFVLAPGPEKSFWFRAWPLALGLVWLAVALVNLRPEAAFRLGPDSATMRGAEAGLVAFLVHGLLDFDLTVQGIAQAVAMTAAVVVSARISGPARERARVTLGSAGRTVLALGSLALAFGLWFGLAEPAILGRALREGALSMASRLPLDERLRMLERSARLDPLDDRTQAYLSHLYSRLRERIEARRLRGDTAPAGAHWADSPTLAKVTRHAGRAAELNPWVSAHHKRLAEVHLEAYRLAGLPDMLKKAHREMRRAVRLFPSKPSLYVELARISELDGQPGGAVRLYRKALELTERQAHGRNRLSAEQIADVRKRIEELEAKFRPRPREG